MAKTDEGPKREGVPLVIITGLSGAGKSTAMRFFEDLGCYCLDNLPPAIVPLVYDLYLQTGAAGPGVAIASDVRSGTLFADFRNMVEGLRASRVDFKVVFLDCGTGTLIRRFQEVRRNHPLQVDRSMEEAIEEERRLLEPIREVATRIVDTSGMSPAELRDKLVQLLHYGNRTAALSVELLSFGFKHGVPRDVDFVFDVRFLPNPFYVDELQARTGEDDAVYDYVMRQPLAEEFFQRVVALLELTFPSFLAVGKRDIAVGIGCTGGRHRSVAFARRLAAHFAGAGLRTRAVHRDAAKPQS